MNSILKGLRRMAAQARTAIIRLARGFWPKVKSGLASREAGQPITDPVTSSVMDILESLEARLGIRIAPAQDVGGQLRLA